MANSITCPHCRQAISIDEALSHQIQEKLTHEYEQKLLAKDKENADKLEAEKQKIYSKAKSEVGIELQSQIKVLQMENELKEKRLAAAQESELELRKAKLVLEEEKRSFELEKQRQLDEERIRIREAVAKESQDLWHLKEKEYEKRLNDMKEALDDMKRKTEQGSQQLQGEVLELEIEELLRATFPNDLVEPIGKGVNGADIKQLVRSPNGRPCGTILWETKRTKNWTESWIGKLKDDLRVAKADIAAIISVALPEEAKTGMGLKDGVWVCGFNLVVPLASLLRKALLDSAYQKAVSEHRGRKADLIYDYITGHEFRQQVEAMVEVFQEMREQINKERVSFERSWKQRESQVGRLFISTANVYGSIQGLAGSSVVPQLKGLDLPELPDGDIS